MIRLTFCKVVPAPGRQGLGERGRREEGKKPVGPRQAEGGVVEIWPGVEGKKGQGRPSDRAKQDWVTIGCGWKVGGDESQEAWNL